MTTRRPGPNPRCAGNELGDLGQVLHLPVPLLPFLEKKGLEQSNGLQTF